jgi:hypothetical protein
MIGMDKKDISDVVMKLFLYGDVCKMIHYSTEKMHNHKLCDEVRDMINDFADNLAESSFGHTGKPSFGDFSLKLSISSSDNIAVVCKNVLHLVDDFRNKIKDDDKYSGIVSIIDDFKSDLSQKVYLSNFDNVSNEILNESITKAIENFKNAEKYSK